MLLRRSTDRLLSALLWLSVLPALAGATWTIVHRPRTAADLGWIFGILLLLALAMSGRGSRVGASVIVLLLATYTFGAACLHHRFGVSKDLAALALLAAVALIVTILLRALRASGSADYPYDE